jgi:uncharacterized protein
MHVLITGGSGFIGTALSRHLQGLGHAVTVLTRSPATTAGLVPGAHVIDSLADASGIDAVVNLAGEPLADGRWSEQKKRLFRSSRIDTTRDLVEWMRDAGPARPQVLVSGSAIGYYGPRGDDPLDETQPPGNDFPATLCRDWERTASDATALGIRTCTIRTGIVLHPDGGALRKMLLPFRLGVGGPMGDGRQWMSWITRDDLVALLTWLLLTPTASGCYNGTAPAPVRNREFADTLAAVLHRPALLPTPAPLLRLVFGEMADLLLTGQRVLPRRALEEGFRFRHATLERALRTLLA